MKKYGVIALIAALVLGLAMYLGACGGGGGGGGGGTPLVSYGTSTQAAAGVKSATGAVTLSSTIGDMTSGFADGAVPPGYAPARKARARDNSAIANIDPRLKTAVDRMSADLKSPAIQKAIAKARALKTSSALASSITISTDCSLGGYFTISGTNSSTTSYDEFTINVAYYNCIEGTDALNNNVASGSLHYYDKYMLDNTARNESLTANNLTLASYASGTLTVTGKTNGTLSSVYSFGTNSVETWQNSANASYSLTFNDGYDSKLAFSMNNVSSTEVYTPGAGGTWTDDFTTNGGFVFTVSNNSGILASIALVFTNLDDKYALNADQTFDRWLNGSFSLTWAPSAGNDCMPGKVTLGTAANTPIHYGTLSDFLGGVCPLSGTLTLNNATIEFGVPSPPQVTVTVGTGTPQVFSDCNFVGADTCVSQPN